MRPPSFFKHLAGIGEERAENVRHRLTCLTARRHAGFRGHRPRHRGPLLAIQQTGSSSGSGNSIRVGIGCTRRRLESGFTAAIPLCTGTGSTGGVFFRTETNMQLGYCGVFHLPLCRGAERHSAIVRNVMAITARAPPAAARLRVAGAIGLANVGVASGLAGEIARRGPRRGTRMSRQPPSKPPRRNNRSTWMIAIALLLIWVANLVFTALRDLLQ